ncbi:hypothetical protein TWF192_005303 [Orbilia oligospora]|uniref:Uncharacterized protein n=1 Tax=Orbilia oligospora TaxID=2813651 RepID=A0A6G1MA50_ORBOL|nr:hypothetical protein TWF191_008651 [Orbilia oligospora]KAF3250281.1 hypothetical protein TWF192_005303 [Orbilia oligospora]
MTTGRNRNGDETTKSLGDYVREGQYNLQHRICEIGKWVIHSGTTQHVKHSQYELWVHKVANSLGQLEAFAENFDLGGLLGCDQGTSELPLTGGEVLALVYICGNHDRIVQFHPVDRTTVGDQTLNQQVRPQELLKMTIIRAFYPVPSRIQKSSWEISTSLVRKGLKCTINKSRKKGKTDHRCVATVSCAGVGFKVWMTKAVSNSAEAAFRKLSQQLYRQINADYDHDHFISAKKTSSLGLGGD